MNTTTGVRTSRTEPLELVDVRGDVILRGDSATVAALIAGPNRDRFWIREADGQTLAARAWERSHGHAA
jgi:hypothetical protein